MSKSCKNSLVKPILLVIVFLITFLLSAPAMVVAQDPPKEGIRSGTMTIKDKTDKAIVVGERHFLVTEDTTILDVKGEKIQLKELTIPSYAKIEYQLRMDEDPLCMKITILRRP